MTRSLSPGRRTAALAAVALSASLAVAAVGGSGSAATATTATTTATTAASTGDTREFEAENGVVVIPVNPLRIVTIGNTTMPFIDLGGVPVGVTEIRGSQIGLVPAEQRAVYEAATNLGTSADEVDMEKLASLEPDLILAQFPGSEFEQLEDQLQAIAPTVFWGLGAEWKEFADALADAGNLTDGLGEQKAQFDEQIAGIQERYADLFANTSFVNVDRWASSDPGTFSISDFGCVEIAQDDIGMNFPRAAEGDDPLGWTSLPFEQIAELADYDVITYPVDAEGNPTETFAPVVESNIWQALPNVQEGRALGVFCPGNNSYRPVLQYLDSLDAALATLAPDGAAAGTSSGTGTAGETRQFVADNGTIEIPVDPQRIVAIGSAATYLNLGVEPIGMPRATERELPWLSPEQQQINEAAVDTGDDVDYETVATLEPDLIVLYEPSHVLPGYNEERLRSIAPTVYITLDTANWKTQVERLADAVDALDNFNADKAEYEALVADIKDEFADVLDSTDFVVLNRFGGGTGPSGTAEFFWEYPDSFCTNHLGDVGLNILPENPPTDEVGDTGTNVSMEQLSDTVADADVIIYPLGADGSVKPEFVEVLESNIWQTLPQVQDGRAIGVQCNTTAHTYSTKIASLESLAEALATLSEAE